MTTSSEELRRKLINAGFRTLGFEFDGSGDSGCVHDILVPTAYMKPLNDMEEIERLESYSDTTQPVLDKLDALVGTDGGLLDNLAYAALEHFPGDWVNNEGGYGTVWIDLLTADFQIDGWQRVVEEQSADSSGSLASEAIDSTGPIDVSQMLKATLGVF